MGSWTISSRTYAMPELRAVFRSIVLGIVALPMAACAIWFVPESRSRGHIFDESVRGIIQLVPEDSRQQLDRVIHETFPPGTPVTDVIGHIEGAGGVCQRPTRSGVKPSHSATICTYESTNYFAWAYMGMGEPIYARAENVWTVFIRHSDDVTTGYFVESQATFNHPSREDYLEGLDRQRAEEEEPQHTDVEN